MPTHAQAARPSTAKLSVGRGPLAAVSGTVPSNLLAWYLGLIPHWVGAKPELKCRLLLRTHQWIVERVLDPEVGLAAAAAELRPAGALTRMLNELVPAEEAGDWSQFIDVVVANLRHALLLPVARRNEAWLRWLFLIPYSVRADAGAPVDRPRPRQRTA